MPDRLLTPSANADGTDRNLSAGASTCLATHALILSCSLLHSTLRSSIQDSRFTDNNQCLHRILKLLSRSRSAAVLSIHLRKSTAA